MKKPTNPDNLQTDTKELVEPKTGYFQHTSLTLNSKN